MLQQITEEFDTKYENLAF